MWHFLWSGFFVLQMLYMGRGHLLEVVYDLWYFSLCSTTDALRKIFDVNKGYVANPKYRSANYGLTATQPVRSCIKDKLLCRGRESISVQLNFLNFWYSYLEYYFFNQKISLVIISISYNDHEFVIGCQKRKFTNSTSLWRFFRFYSQEQTYLKSQEDNLDKNWRIPSPVLDLKYNLFENGSIYFSIFLILTFY